MAKAIPRSTRDERIALASTLTNITTAAAERLYLVTVDDVSRHALLDQQPPVMTLREFDRLHQSWLTDTSAAHLRDLISKHATACDTSEADALEACVRAALRRRGGLIDEASETIDALDAQRLVERTNTLFLLLEQLIGDLDGLGEQTPGRISLFMLLRRQTSQFANRLTDEAYAESRARQRELLFRSAPRLRDRAADVLKELKPWDRLSAPPRVAGADELDDMRGRLNSIFGEFVCDSILDRFKRSGGIAAIGNFTTHPAEVWLLLDRTSPFHQAEYRSKLKSIAEEGDQAVAHNFLAYLRMLAGPDSGFTASALAQDADLIVPAWRAASRVQPQPKMQGLIIELVNVLRKGFADPDLIQMPGWIDRTVADAGEKPVAPEPVPEIVPAAGTDQAGPGSADHDR